MCGLVAIYSKTLEKVSLSELKNINEQMINRGPDGSGIWVSNSGKVGLAHRRLSIIDISDAGLQPMSSICGKIIVTYNGEIYNFKELKSKLESFGHIFVSNTDTEVLVAGWKQWGDKIVNYLRGMFAFVIWDESKKIMFIARDSFGIKPLYFYENKEKLILASQVKALKNGEDIDLSPDPAGHVGFFLTGYVPDPYTFYKNIRSFPAGHSLIIKSDGTKKYNHFGGLSNLLKKAYENKKGLDENENKKKFREALSDSVSKHLISDVKTCLFLSSGLDSSALAFLASEVNSNINTVTLGFKEFRGLDLDETPIAKSLSKIINSQHTTSFITKKNFDKDLSKYLSDMDQPTIDGINTWYVSKIAKENGAKVALSGLGADEILGGYPSFQDIPKFIKLTKPFKGFSRKWGASLRKIVLPIIDKFTSSKYAGIFEYSGSYNEAYFLRRALYMPWELNSLLPYDLIKEGLPEIMEKFFSDDSHNTLNSKARLSYLEMKNYMKNQLLITSDWTSMAHGLELRVPFLDEKVLMASPFISKKDLLSFLNQEIKESLKKRKKTGFETPLEQWIKKDDYVKSDRGLRNWSRKVYESYVTN